MYTGNYFYNEFIKKVNEQIVDIETYKKGAQFTPIVTNIIKDIIRNMGFTPSKEYFRIDVTGWLDRKDDIKGDDKGLNHHLWDLKIAVEHENKRDDWTDELIKLVHIRCPIKIIIGYNSYDNRNDMEKLEVAAEWMKMTEAFCHSKEEYVVIIGNDKGKDKNYTSFEYRGYSYNYEMGKFEEITII